MCRGRFGLDMTVWAAGVVYSMDRMAQCASRAPEPEPFTWARYPFGLGPGAGSR